MQILSRAILPVLASGAVALVAPACSSTSSTAAPPAAETTAAKVSAARAEAFGRMDQSTALVNELGTKIPTSVTERARCVMVVPGMTKGGVVIGAQAGRGYATCETPSGWSAPAPVSIAGGTIGAQLGVESTDLIALVTTGAGTKALQTGNFRLGVDASAAAGPVGTGVGAGPEVASSSDVLSYSRSKGLFAGANLDGSTVTLDADAARTLYASDQNLAAILAGRVPAPQGAPVERFFTAIRAKFGEGRSSAQ